MNNRKMKRLKNRQTEVNNRFYFAMDRIMPELKTFMDGLVHQMLERNYQADFLASLKHDG